MTSKTWRAPKGLGASLCWLLLLSAALACSRGEGGPEDSPRPLLPRGVAFDGAPVLCLPGKEWTSEGGWSFRGAATVACAVRETPADGWWFELEPAGPSATFRFAAFWNGEALADLEPDAGPWSLFVPSSRLTAGEHVLEIRRVREYRDQVYGDRSADNRFHRLRGGADPETLGGLPTRAHPSVPLLADFLRSGVAGRGPVKRGGWMFVGPRSRRVTLEGPATLHLRPENFSSQPARFRARPVSGESPVGEASGVEVLGAEAVDAEVPAGFATSLALELPAGESTWEFAVDGMRHGLFLWSQPRLEAPSERPPIVLLTLDTTRRDALSPYGAENDATPELARFARRATLWEDAHATSPWTLPSHASMFTGLYPSRHRAGVVESALGPTHRTLAEHLRDAGYSTLGFVGGSLSASRFGVAQGFDYYRDPERYQDPGDVLLAAVRRALEEPLGGPPFLFVNLFDPHAPYAAPEPHAARWQVPALRSRLPLATPWARFAGGDQGAWRRIRDSEVPADEAALAWIRAAYRAEVSYADALVGELFALLASKGLFEDAWVVVTADHGELLGEGGFFSHGARLDPELVEVPLLIKAPRQRSPGRRDGLVSGVDLFPSLLAAAGLAVPPSDGRDLMPGTPRAVVLFEEHRSLVHPLPPAPRVIASNLFGLRRGGERQVFWEGGDECRRRDGAGWREMPCPEGSGELRRRLFEQLATPTAAATDAVAGEEAEALRALGYL